MERGVWYLCYHPHTWGDAHVRGGILEGGEGEAVYAARAGHHD